MPAFSPHHGVQSPVSCSGGFPSNISPIDAVSITFGPCLMHGMLSQQQPAVGSPQAAQGHPSDSGTVEGASRPSHGRQKRLACRRCQARKIKCDGSLPKCSACQRARTECVDGKTTWQGPSISRREAVRLQEQNRRLLEVVRERWPDIDVAALGDGHLSSRNHHGTSENSTNVSSTTQMPMSNTRLSSPDAHRTSHLPRTPETSEATPQQDSSGRRISGDIAHEIGMIPLSAGVNKYVGPSSGFSIAKLVLARADQASGYNLGASQTDETTAEARCRSMFMISPSALPASREQAAQLSRIYFEQVHPRYPFLHQQSHFRSLDEVYNNSPVVTRSVEFQVTMVLAISATILSRRLRIPFSGEGLCAAAMEYADEIDFQSSTEGVQCLLLISMFTLHSPFLGINPWYLNYQCLAAVLDLGLQQDLSVGQSIDSFEREMRTRVFWVVFSIDRIIATTLGRPVGLRDESCDLRLPMGLEDHQLDDLKGQDVNGGQPPVDTTESPGAISCAIVHFKLSLLNSEIMYTLHSISPNAPQHTYPRIPDVEAWQNGLYDRLVAIRRDFPSFGDESKHLLALCEIRYHEIVMLLFRPTPRIRSPSKDSLTHCYQSAEATIRLWKDLYNSDRMSYSWTSIHSICLSAITILYCIWMVKELTASTEIDSLTQMMVAASNLLSAAGEHWIDARRCRNSLNNLTAATVRWLVNLRSANQQQPRTRASDCGAQTDAFTQPETAVDSTMVNDNYTGQQQQALGDASNRMEEAMFNPDLPWVDTYINGEDLVTLFRAPNSLNTDPSLAMEGMFSDYQPLFDFYQGNEFGM